MFDSVAPDPCEDAVRRYIADNQLDAEQRIFESSCHTVNEAAQAIGGAPMDLVKNICMLDEEGLVVTIVRGDHSVSRSRVSKALGGTEVRLASADEVQRLSGFPAGGVPSFGFNARFIVDSAVMEMEEVHTGGGSSRSLVRITPMEMVGTNGAKVNRIRR